MDALPAEKQWEMYEAVMKNCGNCQSYKDDVEQLKSDKSFLKGCITAISIVYGVALAALGYYK